MHWMWKLWLSIVYLYSTSSTPNHRPSARICSNNLHCKSWWDSYPPLPNPTWSTLTVLLGDLDERWCRNNQSKWSTNHHATEWQLQIGSRQCLFTGSTLSQFEWFKHQLSVYVVRHKSKYRYKRRGATRSWSCYYTEYQHRYAHATFILEILTNNWWEFPV